MTSLAIGDVGRLVGLRPSAIRFYERQGLLPPPRRINGRRRYDPSVLDRLKVVRMAQAAGFTVAEIRQLVAGFPAEVPASERWRPLAQRKRAELDALIAEALAMQQRLAALEGCACPTLTDCAQLGDDPAQATQVRPDCPARA